MAVAAVARLRLSIEEFDGELKVEKKFHNFRCISLGLTLENTSDDDVVVAYTLSS